MEKLTKQQIVLVTLLVSFVTSIATGIVTVALMDQAPAGVTQTINRVVERTIQTVVTEPAKTNNSAAAVTRETIVVKEDDQIVLSVDKNKNSVVRIYTNNFNQESPQVFIGLGTIVSKEGLIATGDVFADPTGKYIVTLDNNKFYPVTVLTKKDSGQFYFLRVVQDSKNPVVFTPVTFSNSDSLKLGQAVIAWGGQVQNSVSTGIISNLVTDSTRSSSTTIISVSTTTSTTTASLNTSSVLAINTNINLTDSLSGGPLLNLYGEVVGLRVSPGLSDKYNFLPSNLLKQEVVSASSL